MTVYAHQITPDPVFGAGISRVGKSICRQSNGRLWVVATLDDANRTLRAFYSDDGGQTWSVDADLGINTKEPCICVDGQDVLHVAWATYDVTPRSVLHRRRTSAGWQPVETIESGSYYDPERVMLAVDANDVVHCLYYWYPNATRDEMKYCRRNGSWGAPEVVYGYDGYCHPGGIVIDDEGNVHSSSKVPASGNVRYWVRDAATGNWSFESVGNIPGTWWYSQVMLDENGYPHIIVDYTAYQEGQGCYCEFRWDGASWQAHMDIWGGTGGFSVGAYAGDTPITLAIRIRSSYYLVLLYKNPPYTGGWGAEDSLSVAVTQVNQLYARFPIVSGARTNQPETGFAGIYRAQADSSLWYFTTDDLAWPVGETEYQTMVGGPLSWDWKKCRYEGEEKCPRGSPVSWDWAAPVAGGPEQTPQGGPTGFVWGSE